MRIRFYTIVLFILSTYSLQAQIGYQVSLLNSATGEPRANETVSVTVEITNSENTVICSETKSATTDDFGVLSLQVGTANTFKDVDWSKLPLYVSATVDGIMVGKSQILNVPVAEAAKTLVNVDPDLICKTWTGQYDCSKSCKSLSITLTSNKTYVYTIDGYQFGAGEYIIHGNQILLCNTSDNAYYLPSSLVYNKGNLYGSFGVIGYIKLY